MKKNKKQKQTKTDCRQLVGGTILASWEAVAAQGGVSAVTLGSKNQDTILVLAPRTYLSLLYIAHLLSGLHWINKDI